MSEFKNLAELFERREIWKENPDIFMKEFLNVKIPFHQKDIIKAVKKYKRVSVRSANSVGKSFCISALILWFFYCYMDPNPKKNLIIVFTAPTFDQVRENIFANVKEFIEDANTFMKEQFGDDVEFIGRVSDNQNTAEIRFRNKDYIKGVSSSGENKTVGKHGTYVLIIYDEAQGITDKMYSDFKGIVKSGTIVKEVMIGNTTLPYGKCGEFYESFGPNSVFHQIKISAFDTPSFVEPNIKLDDYFRDINDVKHWRNKLDIYCGTNYKKALKNDTLDEWELQVKQKLPFGEHLINPIEVDIELTRCGMDINSYEFLTRVLAEFPNENSSSLYPSDWIAKAFDNYHNPEAHQYGPFEMGIDVAGGLGRDDSSIAIRNGNKIIYSESFDLNAPDLVRKIAEVYEQFPEVSLIKIERDAIGKPVYDLLLERKDLPQVVAVVSGSSPGLPDPFTLQQIEDTQEKKLMFNRKRDEICWNIRELLNPIRTDDSKSILLPPSLELKKQMAAYSYKKMPKGQIIISSKEDIKKIIKKSPDKFDAIIMAFAETEAIDPYLNMDFIDNISGN